MSEEKEFNGLEAFLNKNTPEIAKAYEEFYRQWQLTPTDDDLKVAVIEGLRDLNKLYRAECTKFVDETLSPLLKAAIKDAFAPMEQAFNREWLGRMLKDATSIHRHSAFGSCEMPLYRRISHDHIARRL